MGKLIELPPPTAKAHKAVEFSTKPAILPVSSHELAAVDFASLKKVGSQNEAGGASRLLGNEGLVIAFASPKNESSQNVGPAVSELPDIDLRSIPKCIAIINHYAGREVFTRADDPSKIIAALDQTIRDMVKQFRTAPTRKVVADPSLEIQLRHRYLPRQEK